MKKTLKYALLIFLLAPSFVLALDYPPTKGGNPPTSGGNPVNIQVTLDNPFKVGNNLYDLLQAVVNNVILPIGGVLCVLAFIYAGFKYVMAQGNPTKIAEANRILMYAAIGTAVLLGSWVIATAVRTTVTQLFS